MNIKILEKIVKKEIYQFREYGTVLFEDENEILVYKNNDSKILGVAHLDSVIESPRFVLEHGDFIFSPQLDDRLGVYTLLYELPNVYEINLDILLTSGEEMLQSTAILFDSPKEYNWIVEFDRVGESCVHYQYTNPQWLEALKKYFINISVGSYTDIVDLDFLGVCGMNVGVGYMNNHSINSYMIKSIYKRQIERFVSFYEEYKDKKFIFEGESLSKVNRERSYKYCVNCGTVLLSYEKTFFVNYCEDCVNNLYK